MEIRLFDAAGDTFQTLGVHPNGDTVLVLYEELDFHSSEKVRFAGPMESPFQTYAIDYFGDLESRPKAPLWDSGIERFSGLISETREYFDGKLAVKIVFSPDVRAQQFINDYSRQLDTGIQFVGNAFANEMHGGEGNDTLRGQGGNDFLDAGLGDDRLFGGEGNDRLFGDLGTDRMAGGTGNDTYVVSVSDTIVERTGEGRDTIFSNETTQLARNVEVLGLGDFEPIDGTGNGAANVLLGGSGDNVLRGLAGRDKLSGGDGDDTLVGGDGNDVLVGGRSQDILWGGDGGDRFRFEAAPESGAAAAARDRISDFLSGTDTIDLEGIDARTNRSGDDAFTYLGAAAFTGHAGELTYQAGVLRGDTNGDAKADFSVELASAPDLVADDLIL